MVIEATVPCCELVNKWIAGRGERIVFECWHDMGEIEIPDCIGERINGETDLGIWDELKAHQTPTLSATRRIPPRHAPDPPRRRPLQRLVRVQRYVLLELSGCAILRSRDAFRVPSCGGRVFSPESSGSLGLVHPLSWPSPPPRKDSRMWRCLARYGNRFGSYTTGYRSGGAPSGALSVYTLTDGTDIKTVEKPLDLSDRDFNEVLQR